jgi:hypothetical protein
MTNSENPHAWQDQVQAAFAGKNEAVGERHLAPILFVEQQIGRDFRNKFQGHRLLAEAFFDLFAETLTTVIGGIWRDGWPEQREDYTFYLPAFVTLFRTLRAADILAVGGYRLDGYAHLRGGMDQIIGIAGVANGLTTFRSLFGVAGYAEGRSWTQAEIDRIRPNKIKVERDLHRKLLGPDSGLSQPAIDSLLDWDRAFDKQVHGGLFTFASEAKHWFGRHDASASLTPRMDDDDDAMFVNQSDRLQWLAHRLLPTLQVEGREFDNAWSERWTVLDDAFRLMNDALTRMGKRTADAIAELVDAKFHFDRQTYYVEHSLAASSSGARDEPLA